MKISLPFDLLPHLDGTSIAVSYGLKNQLPEKHTVVELGARDAHDLLKLLKALEEELHSRCLRFQKQSRSPLPAQRRHGIEQRLCAVRRAAELIGSKIPPLETEKRAK